MRTANCRHCWNRPGNRSRGLCYRCHSDPSISVLYPTQSKFGRRSMVRNAAPKLPAEPTSAKLGSAARIEIMAARAAAGESVFHPLDSKEWEPIHDD